MVVIGTEEAWALQELPSSMAVVGAGASGTEIASAYARMGVGVTLFEALDRVLPTEDADVSKVADRSFKKQGSLSTPARSCRDIEVSDGGVSFTHGEESGQVDWPSSPRAAGPTSRPGLEEAGVKLGDDGLSRSTARCAHPPRASGRSAISSLGRRSAQGLGRGRHRRGGHQGPRDAPHRIRGHLMGDVLHAERRQLRAHRGAGLRGRPRRQSSASRKGACATACGDRTGLGEDHR